MIVKKFGGEIDYTSQFGKGSTFFYTFQIQKVQDSDLKSNSSLLPLELAEQPKKMMVIDDEEFCISSMKVMLQKAGIDTETQVDFCINGQEALSRLKATYEMGSSYSLILTDFNMPVLDGIEATARMREYLTNER